MVFQASSFSRMTNQLSPDALKALVSQQKAERPVTKRQKEIWMLVALGVRTADIASKLGLSSKTIETHVAKLKQRTGCRNTSDLTRAAIIAGLIVPTQTA
jgi:DNA-binding NarL/FixJ family response regulator